MKLRNILLYITMLTFTTIQLFANTNPVVANVAFTVSGTTVTVTYDLSDVDVSDTEFTVYMEVSEDRGTTWDFDYGSANGDIGGHVTKGTGKTITWTYTGAENSNFKMKILADDLFGDQIYYSYQIYNTVDIDGQIWLKENLNVGKMIISDGNHTGYQQTANDTIEKYCYNNDEANCNTYGGLYEWTEAMQYVTTEGTQGICPSGWHIPTKGEYKTLQTYVGNEATKLIDENAKSGYTYTNETGFSALFAGSRHGNDGSFVSLGGDSGFWSSTGSSYAGYVGLDYGYSGVDFSNGYKDYGFSVRCLKD